MRKPIIVGNWKMNKTMAETYEFVQAIDSYAIGNADYGIGVPFTDLVTAASYCKNLIVAAQNCNEKDSGAYTGEVSVPMLKETGITYCIIGHSERRTYYNETDAACAA